ncbi:MAG: hypothetical protein HY708_02155 [Ignavibacteriae bacterium]|nr:hypothetical protein [Ignavibacteriota bacterium]
MKKFVLAVVVLALVVAVGNVSSAAGKMALSVGGDVLIPMGTFADGASTGFGGSVRFQYDFTPMFSAGITSGYYTWSGKDQTVLGATIKGVSLKGVPARAFGKYYFMPAGGARVYGIAELGVFFSSVTVPSQTVTIGGVSVTTPEASASSTDFNYAPGLGVELPLGSGNAKIDVSARYDGIATSGSTSGSVGGRVGVTFGLGN